MRNKAVTLNKGLMLFFLLSGISTGRVMGQSPYQDYGRWPRTFTSRKSFWLELNIGGSLSKDSRWQYQIDYQYRRMADANYIQGGDHGNIFKDPYQQVFRPWLHYWAIPGAVRLSLSPLGYWVTWTPGEETSIYPNKDGVPSGQSVFPEFRICPQVMTVHNIGRAQFIQRYRYEFRFLGERRAADNNISDLGKGFNFAPTDVGNQSASQGWYGNNHYGRLRVQTRLQVPINHAKVVDKTWYINTWNELFLSMGHHVKNDKLLNQNRFVALLGYRFNKNVPIKIEGGVTFQSVFLYNTDVPPTNPAVTYQKTNVENNTAYTIYVIFDEFHKLFGRKKMESTQ